MNNNLKFILEYIRISFKSMNQYKGNLYSAFSFDLLFIIIMIFFLHVMFLNINDLIGWSFVEYVFFIVFISFFSDFGGFFAYKRELNRTLISGRFNNFLMRPINLFVQYLMDSCLFYVLPSAVFHFFILIGISIYYIDHFLIFRYLGSIFLCILGFFMFVVVYKFFDSLSFFMKSNYFVFEFYNSLRHEIERFPIHMFANWIGYIGYFIGTAYFSSYAVLFLFGNMSYKEFWILVLFILVLLSILIISIKLMWRLGLEKYEAYN